MLRRGVRYFRSLHSSSNSVYWFVTCQSVVQHAQIKKCGSEALLTQGKFQCDKVVCDKVACGRVVVSDRMRGVRGGGTCMIRWNCCQFFAWCPVVILILLNSRKIFVCIYFRYDINAKGRGNIRFVKKRKMVLMFTLSSLDEKRGCNPCKLNSVFFLW